VTQRYGDLVEAITNVRFHPVRLHEGYDIAEVDRFLAELLRMADPDGSNSSIVPPPGAPVVPEQRSRLGQFFGRR